MEHRLRLDAALAALARQQAAVVAQLRAKPGDADLLASRRELDGAVPCLRLCERHQLHPDATAMALPWSREHFGGFDLAALDEAGAPLQNQGERIELSAGDLIVTQHHPFNVPPKGEGPTA